MDGESDEKADQENQQPVYAVFLPDDVANSPRTLYSSAKEAAKFATSPELKLRGARFRRFDTSNEAFNFFGSPQAAFRDNSPKLSGSDPAVPFRGPTKIEMNKFKKTVEEKNIDEFLKFVDENPRYLVNTSGDCPAILQEGFRYNVLHVAARSGAGEIIAKALSLVSDISFLVRLYGTNEQDVLIRRENIIMGFLCTPDKGNVGTPLVIGLKFGRESVIKSIIDFVRQPVCDNLRMRLNLDTALLLDDSLLLSRYTGSEPKEEVKKRIKAMFHSFFVPLYRATDSSLPARIFPPTDCLRQIIVPGSGDCIPSSSTFQLQPLLCGYRLAAYAGPFSSEEEANKFYKDWSQKGVALKRSDMDKGYERIGRELGLKHNVAWMESWLFLDSMCDINTLKGLEMIERYLSQLRLQSPQISYQEHLEPVRRRLFEDGPANDEMEGAGDLPEECTTEEPITSEEEFCDASDVFLEDLEQGSADDSLLGITEKLDETMLMENSMELGSFHIASPVATQSTPINIPADVEMEPSAFSDDEYDTPPPSPPPIYILEEATKMDNDLYLALANVPNDKLERFPLVAAFVRQMGRVDEKTRQRWPGTDSPRCPRTRSKQRLSRKQQILKGDDPPKVPLTRNHSLTRVGSQRRSLTRSPSNTQLNRTASTTSFLDRGSYSFVVRTSVSDNASTRAWVFIQLVDSNGSATDKMRLRCSISHRKKFQKGHADLFVFVNQMSLADISKVQIWHQKRGDTKDSVLNFWEIESVDVIEHRRQRLFHFDANVKLGTGEDKETTTILTVSAPPFKVFPNGLRTPSRRSSLIGSPAKSPAA